MCINHINQFLQRIDFILDRYKLECPQPTMQEVRVLSKNIVGFEYQTKNTRCSILGDLGAESRLAWKNTPSRPTRW